MSEVPDRPEALQAPPEGPAESPEEAARPAGQADEEAGKVHAAEEQSARLDPVFSVGDEAIDQEQTDRSARVLSGIPAAVTMGEVRSRGSGSGFTPISIQVRTCSLRVGSENPALSARMPTLVLVRSWKIGSSSSLAHV